MLNCISDSMILETKNKGRNRDWELNQYILCICVVHNMHYTHHVRLLVLVPQEYQNISVKPPVKYWCSHHFWGEVFQYKTQRKQRLICTTTWGNFLHYGGPMLTVSGRQRCWIIWCLRFNELAVLTVGLVAVRYINLDDIKQCQNHVPIVSSLVVFDYSVINRLHHLHNNRWSTVLYLY